MKPLLIFFAVAAPLWVYSQNEPKSAADFAAEAAQHENDPPGAQSSTAGRFQVAMLQGQGGSHIAIRVDTFTGQAWTLSHALGETKPVEGKPGVADVTYVDYWKPCLEPAAMDAINKRNAAESTPAK